MASWFGWGSSSTPAAATSATPVEQNDDLSSTVHPSFIDQQHGGDSSFGGMGASSPFPPAPVLSLDQIKHAGVPINRVMNPYLQMDPSMFINTQPQYIMPEGSATGKGKFEFALGHIGWAVGAGFFAGCARGFFPELLNPETRQLSGKPWLTRMTNATVKHGSGWAQPAGTVVFLYSALEIGLRSVRAEDELNGLAAGALTGALYRSPHGLKASGLGAAMGLAFAAAWALINTDSRTRLQEMFA